MHWVYRFAGNAKFPDPLEEITALAALSEVGEDAYLLLINSAHPPLCGGAPGEIIGLCTAVHNQLILHGTATIKGKPIRRGTPPSVEFLYKTLESRYFCPLEDINVKNAEPLFTSILSEEEQVVFLSGQATAKRLGSTVRLKSPTQEHADWTVRFPSAGANLGGIDVQIVIGLDPTAGTWPSGMQEGVKAMPSFALRLDSKGIHAFDDSLNTHMSNKEFWNRVDALVPSTVCIDGPCATNGPRCSQDWSGWDPTAPNGFRKAERDLSNDGIKLFWTTENTVFGFEGASRWIARSLRLFAESPNPNVIETHPHGAFTYLFRRYGWHNNLPRKVTPDGRIARISLLKAFIQDLDADILPDHDAVDAACAALVAALHARGETKAFGAPEEGGQIWMPNLPDIGSDGI